MPEPECPFGIDLVQYAIDELGYEWEAGYAYNTSGKQNWGGNWSCLPLISINGADYLLVEGSRIEYSYVYGKDGANLHAVNGYDTTDEGGISLPSINAKAFGLTRRNSSVWWRVYAYKATRLMQDQQPQAGIIYKPQQSIIKSDSNEPIQAYVICDGMKSMKILHLSRGYYEVFDINGTSLYKSSTQNVYNSLTVDLPDNAHSVYIIHWGVSKTNILVKFYDAI